MTRLAVVLAGTLLVTGCATRGSLDALNTNLVAAQTDIAALKESQARTSLEGARFVADLKSLEDKLSEIRGSLAETSAELARLRTRVESAEAEIRRTRADLAARPEPVVAPAPPPPPRETTARAAEATFNAAVVTFRAREHGQAVLEFLDFLTKYPKHPLASSAQYWIGEAYYTQRDYRQALAEYQKVLELGGNGKAPDALLKIAQCYTSLREPTRAQQALQQIVKEYPQSGAATRARTLLRARASATR